MAWRLSLEILYLFIQIWIMKINSQKTYPGNTVTNGTANFMDALVHSTDAVPEFREGHTHIIDKKDRDVPFKSVANGIGSREESESNLPIKDDSGTNFSETPRFNDPFDKGNNVKTYKNNLTSSNSDIVWYDYTLQDSVDSFEDKHDNGTFDVPLEERNTQLNGSLRNNAHLQTETGIAGDEYEKGQHDGTISYINSSFGQNEKSHTTVTTEMDKNFIRINDLMTFLCNNSYVSCRDRSLQFRTSTCFECSCDAHTCGQTRKCCPDVDISAVGEAGIRNQPMCKYAYDALYTKTDYNVYQQGIVRRLNLTKNVQARMPLNLKHQATSSITTDISRTRNIASNKLSRTVGYYDKLFRLYAIVDTCLEEYVDTNMHDRCINTSSVLLSDFIPSVSINGVVYRNQFCAACNNDTQSIDMGVVTDCLQLYTAAPLVDDLDAFLEITLGCSVYFTPPVYARLTSCFPDGIGTEEVNTCGPVQGNIIHSLAIRYLCTQHNYLPQYFEDVSNARYKNIFCYLCNSDIKDWVTLFGKRTTDTVKPPSAETVFGNVSLSTTLDVRGSGLRPPLEDEDACPLGHVKGVYGEGCVMFGCPVDEVVISNICVLRHATVSGLVIGTTLALTPNSDTVHTITDTRMAAYTISTIYQALMKHYERVAKGCNLVHLEAFMNISATSESNEIFLEIKIENTMYCRITSIKYFFEEINSPDFKLTTAIPGTDKPFVEFSVEFLFSGLQHKQFFDVSVPLASKKYGHLLELAPAFHCPKVVLNTTLFKILRTRNKIVSDIQQPMYTKLTGLVELCYIDYLRQWLHDTYAAPATDAYNKKIVQPVVSLVSTIISIISTVVVLVTYALFSELRFIPGKMLMLLCFNLLFAQCAFAMNNAFDVDTFACKMTGVIIHVFWLAVIMSMNSCLWLMMRNFQQPLEAHNRATMQSKSNSMLFKFALYCYVVPVGFASLNIAIASSVYNDPYSGYGGRFCFISIVNLKIATFILPLCLVLIANFVMFMMIMFSIMKIGQGNCKLFANKHLVIFFKLSTITGVYWFFGLLYEATGSVIFEYLFIILNGGHGFFLMWSFILNKRVYELYRNYFYRRDMEELPPFLTYRHTGSESGV